MSDDLYIGPTILAPGAPETPDRLARRLLMPLSVVFFVLILVFHVLFNTTRVEGDSMEPTLAPSDRLLLTRSYPAPNMRDVVVFEVPTPEGSTEGLIKRIVAMPGDTVEIRQGIALINGVVEPLGLVQTSPYDDSYRDPAVIPDGHVYVLGDNRLVALDSRDLGPVPIGAIRGRVVAVFAPINRIRMVR